MRTDYDAAIDAGTGYIRVAVRGRRGTLEEPSVVRLRPASLTPRAIGKRALDAADDEEPTLLLRPLARGVVADVETAGWLLREALQNAFGPTSHPPRILACAPSDATAEETESLRQALHRAEVGTVNVVPEPIAAAAGAGLDLSSRYAHLVVDVGEGVTDVAVIREGRIEVAGAVRTACADLRHAISETVAQGHGLVLARPEVERVLEAIGVDDDRGGARTVRVRGRRFGDLSATAARVSIADLRAAQEEPLDRIVAAVRAVWRRLTPEASCEVIENGLCLTGGGARLRGFARRLERVSGLDVHVTRAPSHAVIRGARRLAGL
jgi:rod shape-determining protein MreB and related proteins